MTSPSTATDEAFRAAAQRLALAAPELLGVALGTGGAEADLFLEASRHHRVGCEGRLRGGRLHVARPRGAAHDVAGLGVRVRLGTAVGYVAAPGYALPAWRTAAHEARLPLAENARLVAPVRAGEAPVLPPLPPDAPDRVGMAEKYALVEAAVEAAFALDERVVHATASYHDHTRRVAIYPSWGRPAAVATGLVGLHVTVTLDAGGHAATGRAMTGGAYGFGHFFAHPPEEAAREAVAQARRLLEARPVRPGPMPVVLAAGWGGVWLHEAAGHALEADVAGPARPGARVAPAGLTLVDDPTVPGGRGSRPFDDEATPTAPTVLVEDGLLRAYLTDRHHAALHGLAPTGHALRQDYRHAPRPRMTNLCLPPGSAAPEALIAGVRDGLFVRTLGQGVVYPGAGRYAFEVVEGRRIEGGRLTHPVTGLRLEGRLADALTGLRGVASDYRLDTARGVCEKAGQRVPVSVGMPTVLVEGMTVSGG